MQAHDVTGGGGIGLHVDDTGNEHGRPILFVNGFSTSGLGWIYQMTSDLRDDFRLLTLDIRGHGRSEAPENVYGDPRLWADDIQAVIDELALDTPVLVGSSMGGLFICDYLSVHGETDIAGVNLVGGTSKVGRPSVSITGEDFMELIPALRSNDAADCIPAIDELWRRIPHEPLSIRDHHFMVGITVQTPPHVRRALLDRSESYEDLLPSIDVPVLITHGKEDTIVLPTAGRNHADVIPNARASFYAGIGHAPFLEMPDRFNRELRSFIDSL